MFGKALGLMEKELKIRLEGRPDHERLERLLGTPEHEAEQVNAYLDTDDRAFQEHRIMARIRDEGHGLRLTVKWGAVHTDGYFQAQEEEADLDSETPELALSGGEAAAVLARICPPAKALPLERLTVLGRLNNRRQRYSVEDFELELDSSRYGDGAEDFELELETERPEAAAELIRRLLAQCGARGVPQTQSKYERFLDHCPPDRRRSS